MVPYFGFRMPGFVRRVMLPYCHSNNTQNEMRTTMFSLRNHIVFIKDFLASQSLREECRKSICNMIEKSFTDSTGCRSVQRRELIQKLKNGCNEKLILLGEILTTQCNFYASQRLWRASQVWSLYTKIYSERCFRQMMLKFINRLRNGQQPKLGFLLGASMFFSWENGRITDDEIYCCVDELDQFEQASPNGVGKFSLNSEVPLVKKLQKDGWEPVISQEHFHVWRKTVAGTSLCEYKVFGSFTDIPARVFFNVQMDIEYRKVWDRLVIELAIIDREEKEDGCEVIHWVMHYPFPMYSRDYVYIRRAVVDTSRNAMVLVSRAVEHPACPECKDYVRVSEYSSRMVIRPHKTFDDNGFDYLLTYFDDPRAAFPTPAYNWMASAGVPDFVQKLHTAACELHYGTRSKQQQQQSYPQTSPTCGSTTANQCIYA